MSTNELRELYLSFFEEQQHQRLPSAPLVPENDPTTLFTGSGMQPLVPYLLGQAHPRGQRLVNAQKCFRAIDMDEVGDNRHTTFFEMLGNWSLGDYFKTEQIPWMFSFLVDRLGLDPHNLYVSVYRGNESLDIPRDEISAKLWQELFAAKSIDASIVDFPEKNGLQDGRIFYYDETKNWWSRAGVPNNMPVGEPGGPDSELFWDFGAERQLHEQSAYSQQPCHINCDCGRFMEIGNNVFMEYLKAADGFKALPQKNVDFGGGLERLAAASNNNPDVFLIDVFNQARHALEQLSGKKYSEHTRAFRVVLDHLRAATFLIGDNIVPDSKDQGYFVRRLIRRAVRFAQNLGIKESFTADIAVNFITAYQSAYPNLAKNEAQIKTELTKEEDKFRQTLRKGLQVLQQFIDQKAPVSATTAFDLYQSYGFPIEMTQELAQEARLSVDRAGFDAALKQHQDLSRSTSAQKFKGGLADHSEKSVHYHTATHLLHQALRTVLGEHVLQRGSNITPERLRFDFSHPAKMTPEQINAVEALVNTQIKADLLVKRVETTVSEAKELGALGLFEHKYGDTVSMYTIGDFSREICGGPHVEHTGVLGTFKITKEEAASAGIRRIKAVFE